MMRVTCSSVRLNFTISQTDISEIFVKDWRGWIFEVIYVSKRYKICSWAKRVLSLTTSSVIISCILRELAHNIDSWIRWLNLFRKWAPHRILHSLSLDLLEQLFFMLVWVSRKISLFHRAALTTHIANRLIISKSPTFRPIVILLTLVRTKIIRFCFVLIFRGKFFIVSNIIITQPIHVGLVCLADHHKNIQRGNSNQAKSEASAAEDAFVRLVLHFSVFLLLLEFLF